MEGAGDGTVLELVPDQARVLSPGEGAIRALLFPSYTYSSHPAFPTGQTGSLFDCRRFEMNGERDEVYVTLQYG